MQSLSQYDMCSLLLVFVLTSTDIIFFINLSKETTGFVVIFYALHVRPIWSDVYLGRDVKLW